MKIINKLSILLFFSFLLFSCTTRKKTTEKERIVYERDTVYKRDSIFTEREKLIVLPSVNSGIISRPCDESGQLKPVNEIIQFPYGNVQVNSDTAGNLKVQVNTDSISSVYELQYKERNEKQVHEISELQKELSKEKITPFSIWKWVACISIIINLFLLLFIVIKKYIL